MIYLLALGANLSSDDASPHTTLNNAITCLENRGLQIVKISRFYQTPAVPRGSGPDFVNAAIMVRAELPAPEILIILHEVENKLGRIRTTRWAPRIIDIDLVAADNLVTPDIATVTRWINLDPERQLTESPTQLILPHPRLQDRTFVLLPLGDISPDWVHPILQKTIKQLLADLPSDQLEGINESLYEPSRQGIP